MPTREAVQEETIFEQFPYDGSEETIVDESPMSKQDELRSAKEAMAGKVPLMPELPDPVVDLPRGLFINDEWKTRVEIRELTGEDEEALARFKELVDFYDAVIAYSVARIDDYDLGSRPFAERQGILQQLLIGERESLLVAIARVTYGNEKTISLTCRNCDTEFELDLNLTEDFPPKPMDNPQQQSYTFLTSRGSEITYRLATGADQWKALRSKGATLAEQNTALLSTVISKVDGQLVPDPVGFARRMTMKDRQQLLTKLVEQQPSVDMEVITPCINCEQELNIMLGWGDLFRP